MLWFDVGIKRYTTNPQHPQNGVGLWFDVGIKRYTTDPEFFGWMRELWFDVGIKRYTTLEKPVKLYLSCGLM